MVIMPILIMARDKNNPTQNVKHPMGSNHLGFAIFLKWVIRLGKIPFNDLYE